MSWSLVEPAVTVAVQARDGRAQAYVCGNTDATRNSVTTWLAGPWDGGEVVLERDGWVLEVAADGELVLEAPDLVMSGMASDERTEIFESYGFCRDGAIVRSGQVWGNACDTQGVRFQVDPVDTVAPDATLIELNTPNGVVEFARVDL